MTKYEPTTPDRTNRSLNTYLPDSPPSTGTEEIAEILHAPNVHDVEPIDAVACTANGCHHSTRLFEVTRDGERRVLCPTHTVDFVGVES
jgi:hypothetical protein